LFGLATIAINRRGKSFFARRTISMCP